jgi:hypothetical protein
MSITVCTRAHHQSLHWIWTIQSTWWYYIFSKMHCNINFPPSMSPSGFVFRFSYYVLSLLENVCLRDYHAVSMSVCPSYELLNAWTKFYETWYVLVFHSVLWPCLWIGAMMDSFHWSGNSSVHQIELKCLWISDRSVSVPSWNNSDGI